MTGRSLERASGDASETERPAAPLVTIPHPLQRRSTVFAMATLCCLLWGSAYPAIKSGYSLLEIAKSDVANQILFAGWRFTLAGVLLLAVSAGLGRAIFSLSKRQPGRIALLGLTQTAVQYVFFYIGIAHASGVKSSIMNATGVFFSVALAHFLYADDRLNLRKTVGTLIGFLGVMVVNLHGRDQLRFDFALVGEGFVIIAAFVLAAASIYGKSLSRSIDPMVMTGWQLFLGGIVLTAGGLAFGGRIETLDWTSGMLLLYLALLSSIAFAVWGALLKHNPVGLLAAFNFLVPVFGAALSAIFLGETLLSWSNLAALGFVSIGIWLVTRPHRRIL